MASPLPNTNAPASTKYHPNVHNVPAAAGPARPEIDQAGSGSMPSVLVAFTHFGGALAHMATKPLPKNNQMISDSVHAVTSALRPNNPQSKRSRAKVSLTSLNTLRAMMAI